MIKIIKVYKDSRILENGTLSTLGLGVRTDNEVDILRFKFDDLPQGVGTLLTTLKDSEGELIAFPLARNEEENSFDLEITSPLVSQLSLTFQIQITNDTKVWNSLQATLKVHDCLDIGQGEMPSTIDNWLLNANLILSGIESAETTRNNNENSRITNERLRVQAENEREAYITDLKQRVENGEFDGQDGVSAIISDATATIDSNIGTPSVDITMGGTDLDRTFAFAFHNLKGEKGDTGSPGAVKFIIVQTLPTQDIQIDAVYLVPKQDPTTTDLYDEYMYIDNEWELLGSKQIQVDLTDYVKNTDYATASKGGVFKTHSDFGTQIWNGILISPEKTYAQYTSADKNAIIGKATLENVITGKGLVSNVDYASANTGGVIKVGNQVSLTNGVITANSISYSTYSSASNNIFIGKGTLENVITGKDLTTKAYVDSLVGDINTALDTINGEVV